MKTGKQGVFTPRIDPENDLWNILKDSLESDVRWKISESDPNRLRHMSTGVVIDVWCYNHHTNFAVTMPGDLQHISISVIDDRTGTFGSAVKSAFERTNRRLTARVAAVLTKRRDGEV